MGEGDVSMKTRFSALARLNIKVSCLKKKKLLSKHWRDNRRLEEKHKSLEGFCIHVVSVSKFLLLSKKPKL